MKRGPGGKGVRTRAFRGGGDFAGDFTSSWLKEEKNTGSFLTGKRWSRRLGAQSEKQGRDSCCFVCCTRTGCGPLFASTGPDPGKGTFPWEPRDSSKAAWEEGEVAGPTLGKAPRRRAHGCAPKRFPSPHASGSQRCVEGLGTRQPQRLATASRQAMPSG